MDLSKYIGESVKDLPDEVLQSIWGAAYDGSLLGVPGPVLMDQKRCFDSPFYLATRVLDPYYETHYTEIHRQVMDEVMAPYILGDTVRLQGSNYEAKQYTGLLLLMSRTTFKSTMLRQMVMWDAVYRKTVLEQDARTMFVHRNLEKAIEQCVPGNRLGDIGWAVQSYVEARGYSVNA